MSLFSNLGLSYILFTALHVCLFALALAVCGLYGTDIQRASEAGASNDGKWVRVASIQ